MTTNGESGVIMKISKDMVDIKHVYDKIKEIAESKNLLLQKEIVMEQKFGWNKCYTSNFKQTNSINCTSKTTKRRYINDK